jgi:hypothetical protein
MSYTDAQWDNVMAFLNDEAEKRPPNGIGKTIDTAEEFVEMLRTVEAIKPTIVSSNANETREFAQLEEQRIINARAAQAIQDQIDNHPGNPNPPGP